MEKKLTKHFAEKSFSGLRGVNGTCQNILKPFLVKCFIFFLTNHYIFWFYHLNIFHTTICLYCSIMWFSYETIFVGGYFKYFVLSILINQYKLIFGEKKYCLWSPFLTKCQECYKHTYTWTWQLYDWPSLVAESAKISYSLDCYTSYGHIQWGIVNLFFFCVFFLPGNVFLLYLYNKKMDGVSPIDTWP